MSPEPLVGERGYEGFDWWSGPVVAADVVAETGRPTRPLERQQTPAQRLACQLRRHGHAQGPRPRHRRHRRGPLPCLVPSWPQVAASTELHPSTRPPPGDSWPSARRRVAGVVASAPVPLEWRRTGCHGHLRLGSDRVQAGTVEPMAAARPDGQRSRHGSSAYRSRSPSRSSTAPDTSTRTSPVCPCRTAAMTAVAEAVDGARLLYLDPLVPPGAPAARGAGHRSRLATGL